MYCQTYIFKIFAIALSMCLFGCAATSTNITKNGSAEIVLGELEGRWHGQFPIEAKLSDGSTLNEDAAMRLELSADTVSVYSEYEGTVDEIMPRLFKLFWIDKSAVLFGIDIGSDNDGVWEEIWQFALTMRTKNELIVHWTRMVNNHEMPLDNKDSKFVFTGSGVFRRVQDEI